MDVNFCSQTVGAWKLIGEIIYMIRIAIPIIIVLLGTLDLGKAVIAGEDKKIKEAQKSFIRRLIYGVAIFFVFTIVKTIFGLLNVDIDKGDNKICWVCASKPHSRACVNYVEQSKAQSLIDGNYDAYDSDDYYDNDSYSNNNNDSNNRGNSSSTNIDDSKSLDEM